MPTPQSAPVGVASPGNGSYVDAKYVLEVYLFEKGENSGADFFRSKKLQKSFLLPNVSRCEIIRVPATHRTWTLGKLPVKEHKGYRQCNVYVTGVSGFRSEPGSTRDGGVDDSLSGKARYEELKAFLEEYEAKAAAFRSATRRWSGKAPWLVFRRIWENDAYVIDNVRLRELRDVSNRFQYGYDFQALTEAVLDSDADQAANAVSRSQVPTGALTSGRAREQWESAVKVATKASDTGLLPPGFEGDGFTRAQLLAKRVSEEQAIHGPKIAAAGGDITVLSFPSVAGDFGWAGDVAKVIDGGLNDFKEAMAEASKAVGSASDLTEQATVSGVSYGSSPANAVIGLLRQGDRLNATLRKSWDELEGEDRLRLRPAYLKMRATVNAVVRPWRALFELGGSSSGSYEGSPFDADYSPVLIREQEPVSTVTVTGSDTVMSIAERTLGDRSRYPEILALNEMLSPWELSDGTPWGPGLVLKVPDPAGLPAADDVDLFGNDLMWDFQAEDLVVSGDGYALAKRRDNMIQSLKNRGLTTLGTNEGYPEFGLPELVGDASSLLTVGYLASVSASSFRSDPRIARVNNVKLVRDGDVLSIDLDLEARGGGDLPGIKAPIGGL